LAEAEHPRAGGNRGGEIVLAAARMFAALAARLHRG